MGTGETGGWEGYEKGCCGQDLLNDRVKKTKIGIRKQMGRKKYCCLWSKRNHHTLMTELEDGEAIREIGI